MTYKFVFSFPKNALDVTKSLYTAYKPGYTRSFLRQYMLTSQLLHNLALL